MIAVTCPGCGKTLRVKEDFAGKRGTCAHCKQVLVLPTLAAAPTVAAPIAPPGGAENRPCDVARSPALEDTLSQPEDKLLTEVQRAIVDVLTPAQMPDELGRLGPYRVLKVLGSGGMGLVLQAEDPLLKRSVALKVMRPDMATTEVHRLRFLREAQATAAVEHPNIIHLHQVGEERGVPFLAMPLLKGESLETRLRREGKLTLADAMWIGRQAAEGLAAAHEVGLIHRDIKPANLWLEAKTGLVKILDFGLARPITDKTNLTQLGTILGTPAYMAPEQACGRPIDLRCDLFSLGVVLYRALTGQLPFQGNDNLSLLMALTMVLPKLIQELNPAIPPALADLVMQMLEKDPARRPASAQVVADTLARLEKVATPQHNPEAVTVVKAPSQPRLRVPAFVAQASQWRLPRPGRLGLVITGGTTLLILVVALVFFLRSSPRTVDRSPPSPPRETAELEKSITNSIGMQF
jgi:serine/threonine protein kinase